MCTSISMLCVLGNHQRASDLEQGDKKTHFIHGRKGTKRRITAIGPTLEGNEVVERRSMDDKPENRLFIDGALYHFFYRKRTSFTEKELCTIL